ncbi:unnamed protein product [Fraxinus pennsylvanica]|uniref:Morc S5 domain-containing protein n=1 Tax=Fraxinus pennsylvanica TaxID=56036 RepID=A0AAD1ZCV0_9LAMI|nr:unnamed protein product [Fraxinus pennsylvanica]
MVRTENEIQVKQEIIEQSRKPNDSLPPACFINLSSSDSDSDFDSDSDALSDNDIDGIVNKRPRESTGEVSGNKKKKRAKDLSFVLPVGFLDPLPGKESVSKDSEAPLALPAPPERNAGVVSGCKQFWKAGDFDGGPSGDWRSATGGMDHVRVHPKFLHSNATSHKWVLGAFAELLDNSLDEVCNGATYVNIDMVKSKKDGSKMLLIEDNGGGMDPDKIRQCMSLGYSVKSKMVDTIGQYGNGFKTSTMRLGADVIVFSRCFGGGEKRPTQSIGLLSYTFLRSTGKEDIVVPMLDYERRGQEWHKIIRSSASDWNINVETIAQWSPFSSEADLLRQFNQMKDQGTRIIVYNLWEDDQGLLELDFDTDPHDIQIRGVNRDEKNIQMAQLYPNSRHFLTYRHSLRSYVSILYLRIPPIFRIILRGKDVEPHNIVNDMMMSQEITYRPQPGTDGVPKDANMVASVTIGFVKDAKAHIDVQGFNVYHKNRLIKPFWRLWHAPGSDGRGVIGVLEANFVEPAHDKQGFERTTVLARLEARLIQMQKTYWSSNCHHIGYARRRNKKAYERESSPDSYSPTPQSKKYVTSSSSKSSIKSVDKGLNKGHVYGKDDVKKKASGKRQSSSGQLSSAEDVSDVDVQINISTNRVNGLSSRKLSGKDGFPMPSGLRSGEASGNNLPVVRPVRTTRNLRSQEDDYNREELSHAKSSSDTMELLKEENRALKERLQRKEEEILGDLLHDLQSEKDKCKSLEAQLHEANQKIQELVKEQDSLIDIFSEERERRDIEEENLRKKLKEASNTIQELLDKSISSFIHPSSTLKLADEGRHMISLIPKLRSTTFSKQVTDAGLQFDDESAVNSPSASHRKLLNHERERESVCYYSAGQSKTAQCILYVSFVKSNATYVCSQAFNPIAYGSIFLFVLGWLCRSNRKDKPKRKADVKLDRIWCDKCLKSDNVISQEATQSLPNGIPTYRMEMMNVCILGCAISGIHLKCDWLSSARLFNSCIFKQLTFDDCLVNDGKPLSIGCTISLQCANTFSYPLSISSVSY